MIFAIPILLLFAVLLLVGSALAIGAAVAAGLAAGIGATIVFLSVALLMPRRLRTKFLLSISFVAGILTVACFAVAWSSTSVWLAGDDGPMGVLAVLFWALTIAHAAATPMHALLSLMFKLLGQQPQPYSAIASA